VESFLKNKIIEDIKIGDKAIFNKAIEEAHVRLFGELIGDVAPQHLKEEYAMTTKYSRRIVHGMPTPCLTRVPLPELVAPGGVTVQHNFQLKAPMCIGDTVTAIGEVVGKEQFNITNVKGTRNQIFVM